MDLAGKVVLITGVSQGIGAATARAIAARSAEVVLLARGEDRLAGVADSIRASGGRARTYAVDVSDPDAVSAAAEAIRADAGIPDVIVNNAGIGRWLFIEETARRRCGPTWRSPTSPPSTSPGPSSRTWRSVAAARSAT